MPKYIAVLPWIWKPYRDAFMENCKLEVMEIDNRERNLGIMVSHNVAIDEMRKQNADWLIVLSAAIRFGNAGGLDFIEQLDPTFINISAADKDQWNNHQQVGIYGWHLIAFSRECIEKVGKWDANLSPYGYDDIDYSIRMQKTFPDPEYSQRTKKVAVDASDTAMAHSINLAGIQTNNEANLEYIERKWGVILHGSGKNNDLSQHHDHPFGETDKPLSYWPTVRWAGQNWSCR